MAFWFSVYISFVNYPYYKSKLKRGCPPPKKV